MKKEEYIFKIENSTGKEKYRHLLKYAWYLRQKEPLECARISKEVLKYARKEDERDLEYSSLKYLCYAYFYHSDMETTSKWIVELQRAGKKNCNYQAIGNSYSMTSRVALQQNNIPEAMENILKALECFLKINSTNDLISAYNALGMIHSQRDENKEAEHYLLLALNEAEKIDNHVQHSIRTNLSNIYYKQRKFQKSLDMYLKSLEYFQSKEMESSMATVLLNIGLCYSYLDDSTKALEHLKRSYELCEKINDPREFGLAANAMAHIYILEEDWKNAYKYMTNALQLSEDNNLKFNIISCYSTYIKYYEAQKDYIQANVYLHKLVEIKDEVNCENNEKNFANLEAQYKTQIYKLKNAELDKKNKAMDNQIQELNSTLKNLQDTYLDLQNKLQETLEQLNTQGNLLSSQSRSAMMGEMISAIAHQWKQPLNIIWVMTQAIGEAWDFDEIDDEFMKNQIDKIGEQIMYMSDTVNDFRNFFNSDLLTDFDASSAVERSIKLVASLFDKNGIRIQKELDSNCKLSGNPNELVQVIVNVLNNAIEAVLRSNPSEPKIRVVLTCNDTNITIKIFNKGDQIREDVLPKLFEPYFTTRKNEGTGIGLYICRNIIENKYNGSINARNWDDGVEFEINIPLKK